MHLIVFSVSIYFKLHFHIRLTFVWTGIGRCPSI